VIGKSAVLVMAAGLLAASGCTSSPACGDGAVNEGEDELTCCVDVGCSSGVCDAESMECVDPWALACPQLDGECSAEQPYVCDGELPSYNCGQCGCPEANSCFDSVCIADSAIDLQRTGPMIPDDLPLDEYFSFIDRNGTADAMSYEELVAALDAQLRADGRMNSLLLGETHGSEDEQSVARALLRDLHGLGWKLPEIGVEGATPILDVEPLSDIGIVGHNFDGNLTNDVHCADLEPRIAGGLNNESLYVQYSGSGHTTQEVCHHPMHWGICNLPHVSECATRTGKKSAVVILFDPDPWMWQIDRTLFWRLPAVSDKAAFEAEVDTNRRRWDQSMTVQEGLSASLDGRDITLRALRAEHTDNVFVVYFPRPTRPAYLHETYKAVWDQTQLQDFLVANTLHPRNCSVSWNLSPGEETLWMWCSSDAGYELNATVDGQTFEVTESNTTGPGSATSLRDSIPWNRVQGTTGSITLSGY